jgi:hypothetical protein
MGSLPGARLRRRRRTPPPLRTRGPSGPSGREPEPCARSRTVRPLAADCPRLCREHHRRFSTQWLVPGSAPTVSSAIDDRKSHRIRSRLDEINVFKILDYCNTQFVIYNKRGEKSFSYILCVCWNYLSSHVNTIFKQQINNKRYTLKSCNMLEFIVCAFNEKSNTTHRNKLVTIERI